MKGPKAPPGFRRLRIGEIIKRGDKVARYNESRFINSTSVGQPYATHVNAGGWDEYGHHVHVRRKKTKK